MHKIAAIITAGAMLTGCATSGAHYSPMIDARSNGGNYPNDMAECQSYAKQQAGAGATAAAGAIVGALVGVAFMALAGGKGYRNEAAGIGALTGGLQGAAVGEGSQRDIIRRCLAGRGYTVLN